VADSIFEQEKQDTRQDLYEIKIFPLDANQEPFVMSLKWIRMNPGVHVASYEDREGAMHFYKYEHVGEPRYKQVPDPKVKFPEHISLMLDTKIGRNVIAKASGKKIGSSTWGWANLVPEAQMAGAFQDPNIVTIHDFATNKRDELFMIMEYLPNGNLSDWLKKEHKSWEISSVVEQLSSVLERIHVNHRLVYADLKPINIGFDKDWTVKLMDFEISVRMRDDGTAIGGQDKTFGFAAPEQFGNNPRLTAKTDIYSLGAVVFSILTGIDGGDYEVRLLRGRFEKDPNSLIPFRDGYKKIFSGKQMEEVSRILHTALKENPEERYSSTAVFNMYFQKVLK